MHFFSQAKYGPSGLPPGAFAKGSRGHSTISSSDFSDFPDFSDFYDFYFSSSVQPRGGNFIAPESWLCLPPRTDWKPCFAARIFHVPTSMNVASWSLLHTCTDSMNKGGCAFVKTAPPEALPQCWRSLFSQSHVFPTYRNSGNSVPTGSHLRT